MSAVPPKFLADESCGFAVVRVPRAKRFDARSIAEQVPSTPDRDVLAMARDDARVPITEDKDFGWLVYVSSARSAGVVLLRYHPANRADIAESAVALAVEQADQLRGSFTVVQPGRARFSLRS